MWLGGRRGGRYVMWIVVIDKLYVGEGLFCVC